MVFPLVIRTLFKLPNPILCIAADFQSGSAGVNCILLSPPDPRVLSFITPRGNVHNTASPLYVSCPELPRELVV